MGAERIHFGIAVGASDSGARSDRDLYRTVLGDCEHGLSLGFTSAWFFEHHFSDWYPTPNPTILVSNAAARFPELELGTCVLVLPWYEPLRLAEEIAMLSMLTDRPLHLGLGRGTAKYEFTRFGLEMSESRVRFNEILDVVKLALDGGSFTYDGSQISIAESVEIRPRLTAEQRARVHFYGSVGSPSGGAAMGAAGLRPLAAAHSGYETLGAAMNEWRTAASEHGHPTDVLRPILVRAIVADTDEAALEAAAKYIPDYFHAQIAHYTPSEVDWAQLETYKEYESIFASWSRFTDPANIPAWANGQFVGSPDTVANRVERLIEMGFNAFLIQNATPGVPVEERRRWTQKFATEVAPRFAAQFDALAR